jgi:hypothetical protein
VGGGRRKEEGGRRKKEWRRSRKEKGGRGEGRGGGCTYDLNSVQFITTPIQKFHIRKL